MGIKKGQTSKPKVDPQVVDRVKGEVRAKLKGVALADLARTAKNFSVDVKPYLSNKKMNDGTRAMSIVNGIVGSAARGMRDGMSTKEVLALLKV